jgi:hypothetical protein
VRLDPRAEDDLLRMGEIDLELWDAAWRTIEALAGGGEDPDDRLMPWEGPWRLLRGRHGTVTYRVKYRALTTKDLATLGPPKRGYLVLRVHVAWS